jgi:hypothetical protein
MQPPSLEESKLEETVSLNEWASPCFVATTHRALLAL